MKYKTFLSVLLSAIVISFCAACANRGPGRSGAALPTATVTVTRTPTPEPTAKPVVPIEIDLQTLNVYTHTSNRFKVEYPDAWQQFEQPNGVVFLEPQNRAGYSVFFSDVGETFDAEALSRFLVTFVAQNFAGEDSNFKALSQEQHDDGLIVAQFSSLDSNLGQAISQVAVQQVETVVFIQYITTIQAQWSASRAQLQVLADTFAPLNTTSAVVHPTDTPPEWSLIGPDSKEFAFIYATNWEITVKEDYQVTVAFPDDGMTFTASNFPWPGAKSRPAIAAERAALAHLETLHEDYDQMESLPPAEFPLDKATGTTIDFIYTDENDQAIAGSVITAVGNDKMHKLVFTAPANLYEAALGWFNPMYKSYKFLSPEESVLESP